MAIYRTIQLSFWTDTKVLDEFTPEDKYFYLYLFSNPQTNMCGCYELGWSQTTNQLGYSKESVIHLLDRFENVHKVIKYSKKTKEVLLLNWCKYNWQGGNQIACISKEIDNIKDNELKLIVTQTFNEHFNGSKPLVSPLQATVTVTDTVNNTVSDSFTKDIKEIIDYLNKVTGSRYTYKNKSYNSKITARLKDGFTVDDIKTVIDKKFAEWGGTEMAQYLTPDTLFAPSKFEKYLNQPAITKKQTVTEKRQDVLSSWAQKRGLFDE